VERDMARQAIEQLDQLFVLRINRR
jgi:hypothetical protein